MNRSDAAMAAMVFGTGVAFGTILGVVAGVVALVAIAYALE